MGFFSQIMCEIRQDDEEKRPTRRNTQAAEGQCRLADNAVPETPTPAEPKDAEPSPTLDLSGTPQENEDERRKAHEAAEAKRKAEWEAKQTAKRQAEQEAVSKLESMTDDEAAAEAAKRVGADTERLTRRNMKEMVCEHIQKMCGADPAFARKVMHPRKSMIRCFKFITRKAREYAEQEMQDNGIERSGVYGCDVPDGLCYQWAVDYFNDPHAAEDKEGEEKFVAKPYVPKAGSAKSKAAPKKPPKKQESNSGQMSLLEVR